MVRRLYGIRDKKLGHISFPFVWRSDVEAMRMLQETVNNDVKSRLHMFPEDFELVYVGTQDEETGKIVSDVKFVAEALSLVIVKEKK